MVLITSRSSSLLPTITSRCHQIISTPKSKILNLQPQIVSTGKPQTDLLLSEKLSADKIQFPELVKQEINICHQQLVNNPSPQIETKLEKLILLSQMINANVDPKSALDYFFLT